ncbi:MAG: O-antigen ligase family protein [Bryobacteraceae bacterium]
MRTRNGNSTAAVESATSTVPPLSGTPALETGKFAAILVAAYAFIVESRILDLSSIASLHIPLVIFILLALFTLGILVQRGIHGFLDNKASFCFTALTAWVVLSYPLSNWRAFSFPYVETTIQGLVIFAAVVQIASTAKNWRRIAAAFGYATLAASILSLFISKSVSGRMTIGSGTLADPNEFALALVIGLPFLFYTAAVSKGIKRIALYACSALVLYSFARAGSRGGLLALLAMLLVLFVLGKASQKLVMIVACVVGLAAGAVLLPGYIRDRFTTFFSVHNEQVSGAVENRLDSDVASTEARKQILIQSLQITAEHPLLGVGPGVFPWVAADKRIKEFGSSGWAIVTHNTYTQYSSETGVLGFFFWTGTLYFCIKYTLRVYRSMSGVDDKLATAARDTLAAMIALAVGSCFLSLAYGLKIPVLLGLTVALRNIAEARRANPQVLENTSAPLVVDVAAARPAVSGAAASGPLPPRTPRRADLSGRPRNRY